MDIIKRIVIELTEDEKIKVKGEGYKTPEEGIELIHGCLNYIYGEEVVLMTKNDCEELNRKIEEKGRELNTLTTFIKTLLLLKKMGILDKDVLEILRDMMELSRVLTPEEVDEMDKVAMTLLKEVKDEGKYKVLLRKYFSSDIMYG
ncbi:hypothetical protein [Methanobacterium formicicum]|jgi:predicted Zn-dependent peptidase|uniref:Uncharacterized protein n=1 Tax=Methanobacterium formicicum TaxID=2162 RepID=A0A0S4FQW0_METFO|nr:hypothetical protein [Methanobacterium formicicum]CEL25431.1 hypothetical protein MB9_1801 [Methanobacterium formicicum]